MYGQVTKILDGNKCELRVDDGHIRRGLYHPEWQDISVGDLVLLQKLPTRFGKTYFNVHEIYTPKPFDNTSLERISEWSQEATKADEHKLFCRTKAIDEVMNGNKLFVLGRKGSGKSAIAEYLRIYGDFQTVICSFEHFPFNKLYRMEDSTGSKRSRYITIWQILFFSIALSILSKSDCVSDAERKLITEYLSRFGERRPSQEHIGFGAILINWLRSIGAKKSSKLAGQAASIYFGVDPTAILNTLMENISEQASEDSSYPLHNQLISTLEELKNFYQSLSRQPVLIVFDQLDEEYFDVNSSDRETYGDALRGLFSAAVEVGSLQLGIKPLILLRDDIFESFQGSNKGKLLDYVIKLEWDVEELKRVIAYRLTESDKPGLAESRGFDKTWLKLCEPYYRPNQAKRIIGSFDHFVEHTSRTPRDCVVLLKNIAQNLLIHRRDRRFCDLFIFEKAQPETANYFYQQLIDAVHPTIPDIKEILHAIRQESCSPILERDHLTRIFASMNMTESDIALCLASLYEHGAIGVINSADGKERFIARYLDKDYMPRRDDKAVLHPLLAIKLGVVGVRSVPRIGTTTEMDESKEKSGADTEASSVGTMYG